MFGSVADDVLDLTMEDEQSARDLWVAIDGLFQANKEPYAVFLSHKFHSMTQGDPPVADYCQHMNITVDALCDVGHAVSDPQLVLNLLLGLNPRFPNTADNIANMQPFPSFATARNMLTLKELRLVNEGKVSHETALMVTSSSCSDTGCRSGASSSASAGTVAP
jgi:hypothetical protein